MAALNGPTAALVRAPRQPCRAHTDVTDKCRAVRPISRTQTRSSDPQVRPQQADGTRLRRHRSAGQHLPGAAAVLSAAAALHAAALAGVAFAEDATPPESPIPALPSPPEVVRTLSETIFPGPDVSPLEEAPPVKDAAQNGSGGGGDGGGKQKPAQPAAKTQNGQQKDGGMEGDEQLRQRFEKEILPKIQEQLKALDKNEQPNTTTIELKRQLRRAEDDIYRLLEDVKESKPDAAHAEAAGLAREFEDIRTYVKEHGGMLTDEEKKE